MATSDGRSDQVSGDTGQDDMSTANKVIDLMEALKASLKKRAERMVSGDTGRTERARLAAREAFDQYRPTGQIAGYKGAMYQKLYAACEAYVRALAPEPSGVPPEMPCVRCNGRGYLECDSPGCDGSHEGCVEGECRECGGTGTLVIGRATTEVERVAPEWGKPIKGNPWVGGLYHDWHIAAPCGCRVVVIWNGPERPQSWSGHPCDTHRLPDLATGEIMLRKTVLSGATPKEEAR